VITGLGSCLEVMRKHPGHTWAGKTSAIEEVQRLMTWESLESMLIRLFRSSSSKQHLETIGSRLR
jgi:hypothetical protein